MPVRSILIVITGNSMVRFYVQLRKGKKDQFEYLEVSIDSTFNTMWSYRIMFNWVSRIPRRCTSLRLFVSLFAACSLWQVLER